ncbi:mitochondrial ATPase inhibitor [Histoplasma capsulatum]|uniref:ATPase inhibitor, mitochondrial n=1 Tax=Ajellomyces capsulatus TaxID=5037 RepID=A0A8A1M761_AJECA|nr:predicted protein [Histoplasma mississippiense (nom. inval.)]EDN08016.1 predicted protein [Histoplasma mississippiense (nom. inval.)]QSS61859.1 mitochondrial ATPase inhibitor [Histoplasma capsulatum]
MLRQTARPLLRASQPRLNRLFSVAAARMGEGDVGAPKSTGKLSTTNSWSKKEAADEAMYIKQREMEKLRTLREKLKQQRQHLDELDAHIEQLTREHGGEQN